ncbi:hypothetical protein [Gymnodinialimonas ceratoperidinii]|uniref:Uncharacterized protein n=1 Tax=Gymnodinialimonas ceratoperidinii TaxID=2856823 RepID=A0A8F6TYT0_9RHOB|nr:hypothetical protein [Gymnodinialimonas ceratoperidinii]QXT41190.1 hypothetical protein KYE46_08270 [Gymnodinialimonas ceratoperidinii]
MAGEPIERSEATIAAHRTKDEARQIGTASGLASAADSKTLSEESLDAKVRAALRAENIADARTLVANAEAILSTHRESTSAGLTAPEVAAAKARIAMAIGDGAAARAILLLAIERHPEAEALRSLMTEVMLADGRATDVRPVLRHLKGDAVKAAKERPEAD